MGLTGEQVYNGLAGLFYIEDDFRIAESEASVVRRFTMVTMGMEMMGGGLTINGKKMDINRIDEQVKLGSTEIWEIINRSTMMMSMPHSMHLHDVDGMMG